METIYLEQWLHNLIRQSARKDAGFRQFLGKESLDAVTRADIDRYHLFKLRQKLAYVYAKSTFYRQLFDGRGIRVSEIQSLDDIAGIPFTNPADIARQPYQFACVGLGDIERATTFASSGTTGPRKRFFFTEGDLETVTDFMAAGIRTVAKAGDVVQIMLPSLRPNDQAHLLANGVEKMGGTPVITGTVPSSEEQVSTIDECRPAVLFAGVSRMYRITQETRQRHDLKRKGVRTIFVTSEYLSESMRRLLQDTWGCDVRVHYGLTEMGLGVAIECGAHSGYHFNEADLLAEVVDPGTGAVLDDGREGELVFTSLSLEAMPLIRYRTHDIASFIGGPCECGATTLKRIDRVTRRREAVVNIGDGDELYPAVFDDLLFGIRDIVDYRLTLARDGGKDILLFEIELTERSSTTPETIKDVLLSHPLIGKNVAAGGMALPRIEMVPPGTLVRTTRAKKLIVDCR